MTRSLAVALVLSAASLLHARQAPPPASSASLDLATFRDRVQPMFLDKREGLARCYVCHSQGTPFRLERIGDGRTTWNDEETAKNLAAVQRLVVAGKPEASRLLLMPLAHESGGTTFHPGGKRWTSQSDPEWQELAKWIRDAAR
jgi:hypothetical protein